MSEEAQGEVSEESPPQEGAQNTPSEWFWKEGVKGDGDKPDFLLDKYKSVADQAKSYNDLYKKFGAFTGAPEQYEVEHLGVDPDQHTLKTLMDIGKELNMSQEGLDKLVGRLTTAIEQEKESDLESEISKLGDEGSKLMKQYKYFVDNHLQPEEREVARDWIRTAADLKVFTAMTNGVYNKRIPTENDVHLKNHFESVSELRKEMAQNKDRFDSDKDYRNDWLKRMDYAQQRGSR